MERIDYFIPRQLLYFFGAFWMVGTLPRMLGIVSPRAEFVDMVGIIDFCANVGFFGSLFYVIYAVVHNAKLNQNETS